MIDVDHLVKVYQEICSAEMDQFVRAEILNHLAEYCNNNNLDYLDIRKQIIGGLNEN